METTTQTKPQRKYLPQWTTYKPKKDGNGGASQVQLKVVEDKPVEAFWVSALQVGEKDGNAVFGWRDAAKSVNMKLGEPDIGEILAVLNGLKPIAGVVGGKFPGIFHQNDKGSTSFAFKRLDDGSYSVRVASKIGATVIAVTHALTVGEGQILKVLLTKIIERMYSW